MADDKAMLDVVLSKLNDIVERATLVEIKVDERNELLKRHAVS